MFFGEHSSYDRGAEITENPFQVFTGRGKWLFFFLLWKHTIQSFPFINPSNRCPSSHTSEFLSAWYSQNTSNSCWIFLAMLSTAFTTLNTTQRNNMTITVTWNKQLKTNLCISIFDANRLKPSEESCLFSSKSSSMTIFCFVCCVMRRTARGS